MSVCRCRMLTPGRLQGRWEQRGSARGNARALDGESRDARGGISTRFALLGERREVSKRKLRLRIAVARARASDSQRGGEKLEADGVAGARALPRPFLERLADLSKVNRKWDVPWGGRFVFGVSALWAATFLGVGLFLAPAIAAQIGISLDGTATAGDKAIFLLIDQVCETVAGLGLLWAVTRRFAPLPGELFKLSLEDPVDGEEGWLLWGAVGLGGAIAAVGISALLISSATSLAGGGGAAEMEHAKGTADAVASILTPDPAAFLSIALVTSVLAPLLEECFFRGFVLTSLTKWLSPGQAVACSAMFFACAHLSSHDFVQLTALGVVLALSYNRTGNLATPVLIHACWNTGVLVFLEALFLSGVDVTEMLSKA